MVKELNNESGDILLGVIISLAVLLVVAIIIFGFAFFIKKIRNDIDNLTEEMINVRSEVVISVKEKMVYKTIVNNKTGTRTESYSLDDFIYSLSLNPESKVFRELLKLIDNGSTKTQLLNKFKTIEDYKILVTLKYSEIKASVAIIEIDKDNKNIEEFISFQLSESFFIFKKKEMFQDILTDEINQLNEYKLSQALLKDVKAVKTKGWTIVKIENSRELLPTWKDYLINILQMAKVRYLLKENGIESHFGTDGAVYFVQASGRSSNYFTISKEWNSKIHSMLSNNKSYYFDITSDELKVTTSNDFVKDSRSVNTSLIMISIISKEKQNEKISKSFVDTATHRSAEIHSKASRLLKEMKEGPFPMMNTEFQVREKSPKGIIEFYIDFPQISSQDEISYSALHKREILLLTLKEALKRSSRFNQKICTVMFEMKDLNILASVAKTLDPKDNFYFSFSEDDSIYTKEELNILFNQIKSSGHKLIQLIRNLDDGSITINLAMKPDYILYTKDFSKMKDENELHNINLAKLNTIKDKKARIINIK